MISAAESILHLCAAAAISTAMLGIGLGAIGHGPRRRASPLWLAGGAVGAAMTLYVAQVELRFDALDASLVGISLVTLVGLGGGAALLFTGLRGRRVGDHPFCRRCGFDLTGRPATSVLCSECGADLDARHAIVVGVHERRRGPLLAGAFAAILGVSVGGVVLRDSLPGAGGFSAIRYRPTSWLIGDLNSGNWNTQQVAANELTRRLRAGDLAAADVRRAALAFAPYLAPGSALVGPSNAFVMGAWGANQLDVPTMTSVVSATAVNGTLSLNSVSEPGRVPFIVKLGGRALSSVGAVPGENWTLAIAAREDAINGVPLEPSEIAGRLGVGKSLVSPQAFNARGRGGWAVLPFGLAYRPAKPLPPGVATVTMKLTIAVTVLVPGRAPLQVDVPLSLAGQTTIVPPAPPPADPPPPDPRMEQVSALVAPGAYGVDGSVLLELAVTTLPRNVSFVGDVFIRDAAGERLLGDIHLEIGGGTSGSGAAGRLLIEDPLPAGPFELVFRPVASRAVALRRPALAYPHEFVIKAGRIRRDDLRPPPSRRVR